MHRYKTSESRHRVGAQIVLFVNRYMNERVHLVKSIGFHAKYDNVNMPEEYASKIDAWLRGRLTQIKHKAADRTLKREISKLLGKCQPMLDDPQLLSFVAAVATVLHTGCRPSEAAYVVFHKTIKKSTIKLKHASFELQATAPKDITKTKRDYFWLLPKEFNLFLPVLRGHTPTGFTDFKALTKELAHYWDRKVLKHAKVPLNSETNTVYSLRTVRALRATQWVKLFAEYKEMGWSPMPPNPLSHKDVKMTLKKYALKDCDNIYAARDRCIVKYANSAKLHQNWMDE